LPDTTIGNRSAYLLFMNAIHMPEAGWLDPYERNEYEVQEASGQIQTRGSYGVED
jgi:hypothetical protein